MCMHCSDDPSAVPEQTLHCKVREVLGCLPLEELTTGSERRMGHCSKVFTKADKDHDARISPQVARRAVSTCDDWFAGAGACHPGSTLQVYNS